jgi:nucleoside permease NupC
MLGGLGSLLPPERRADVAQLCVKSIAAGLLSSCITAALMGLLY